MRVTWLIGAATAAIIAGSAPAAAETLREAFQRVYAANPTITGARAGLRATDEEVVIARAAGLPSIDANGTYNEFVRRSSNSFTAPRRSVGGGVTISVPLYSGGAVRNSVKAADARVEAGRADLRSTEANLFVETTAAYMDVIRATSIVELNESNVRVLGTNLQASKDRFEVGDLTRTDVAQSEARLATANSDLDLAKAELDAARENYLRVVGALPGMLEPPPPLPQFPTTPDDAVDVAIANNPEIEASRKLSKAADYDIGTARSFRLPRLSAFADGDYVDYLGTIGGQGAGQVFSQTQKTATIGLQATLPLYQGGEPSARVRQAQARKSQSIEQETLIERAIIADTRTAYSRYLASIEVIKSSETAVSANELALEGVRAENSVGTRDVLDVLNAEQELLNSRVTLVTARRDAYVLGFQLLAAMGRAEARDLGLDGGALYDPTINARRVRGIYGDWDSDPKPEPVATRTYGVSPANPAPTPPPVTPSQN